MANAHLFLQPTSFKDIKILIISRIPPVTFNFYHQKYTWQTASRTKRLKQRLKTVLRASLRDSAVLIPLLVQLPGYLRTLEARLGGPAKT